MRTQVGATRQQTVLRLVAAPPLPFRELLLERRSHSLELTPWLTTRQATGLAALRRVSLVSVGLRNGGHVAIRCSTEVLGPYVRRTRRHSHRDSRQLCHKPRFPGPESTSCSGIPRSRMFAIHHVSFISHWQALGSTFPWAFRG